MLRLKKVLYFTLGLYLVPVCLGVLHVPFLGKEDAELIYRGFAGVYFICYFLFPVLYRGKMVERIPNRYVFYGLMYLFFEVLVIAFYCL